MIIGVVKGVYYGGKEQQAQGQAWAVFQPGHMGDSISQTCQRLSFLTRQMGGKKTHTSKSCYDNWRNPGVWGAGQATGTLQAPEECCLVTSPFINIFLFLFGCWFILYLMLIQGVCQSPQTLNSLLLRVSTRALAWNVWDLNKAYPSPVWGGEVDGHRKAKQMKTHGDRQKGWDGEKACGGAFLSLWPAVSSPLL